MVMVLMGHALALAAVLWFARYDSVRAPSEEEPP